MYLFLYFAKSFDGKNIIDKYTAHSVSELLEYLHARNNYLVYYIRLNTKINFVLTSSINLKELSIFCKQFSVLLHSGITIVEALTLLSVQSASLTLKNALRNSTTYLKKGESLYTSFVKCGYSFPEFFTRMLQVGEESGKLEVVLHQLSLYYEKENKIIKKIQGSALYPLIILSLTIIICTFLLVSIIPTFTGMLQSMNCKISGLTLYVVRLSNFTKNNLAVTLLLIGLFLSFTFYLYASLPHHTKTSSAIGGLPFIKILYKKKLVLKISRAMTIMLSSGLNLINSLDLVIGLIGSASYKESFSRVSSEINMGNFLWKSFDKTQLFGPLEISMIRIGEETGNLDNMFEKLGEILEEDTYETAEKLTQLIQPAMTLFMGLIIGTIVASVMLPMFSIMDNIK